jgi:ornithine cyclodeaminase
MPEDSVLYLSSRDVSECLPDASRQVELIRIAFEALASRDAAMPPKIGVSPRANAVLEAMPSWWPSRDLAGMKWISAYPANRSLGIEQIQGLIVLNDAGTGSPRCIMDARRITAARTAAVSAFAVHSLEARPRARRTALLGAGVQASAHASLLAAMGLIRDLRVFDPHPDRALTLAHFAASDLGVPESRACTSHLEALEDAELVVSCASPGSGRQLLDYAVVARADLVISIDDDVYVSRDVVARCGFFIVDDRAQFLDFKARGAFTGFREPDASLADLAVGDIPERGGGPVILVALGIGFADLVFAHAVYQLAEHRQLGIELPR